MGQLLRAGNCECHRHHLSLPEAPWGGSDGPIFHKRTETQAGSGLSEAVLSARGRPGPEAVWVQSWASCPSTVPPAMAAWLDRIRTRVPTALRTRDLVRQGPREGSVAWKFLLPSES